MFLTSLNLQSHTSEIPVENRIRVKVSSCVTELWRAWPEEIIFSISEYVLYQENKEERLSIFAIRDDTLSIYVHHCVF